jgi:hypothetical protein
MAEPVLNGTYIAATTKAFPLESILRIVWLHKVDNIAVLSRIDGESLRRPKITTYIKLCQWLDDKCLLPKSIPLEPLHRLTDEQLTKRFPPDTRRIDPTTEKKPELSAPVAYRQKWLPVLDDITPYLESVWRKRASFRSLIAPISKKHGVSKTETYQVLYRFLAAGSARQSVISNRTNCGGKGSSRIGKGFNLGRLKTDNKLEGLPNDNFPLNTDWIEKIQDTYREAITRGVSGSDGYQTFLNLHCTTSCTFDNGELKAEYLLKTQRPSKTQFLDHGPANDPTEAIWRKQLVDKEFEKNFKGLYGGGDPKTFRTGILADVDASSNDRYLVSVFNAARGVGTARFIPVVDESIGYIFGLHVAWRINNDAAKLSVLNAASDKVQFCAQYGIAIAPEQWYSCLHAGYRADKGEFNAQAPREALGNLNRSIEFVRTGHPELRGGGEQTHRRLHDHDANGSTHGKFRTRGEKDPAKSADQNIFQYTRELIRLVLWLNNFAPANHLLDSEMRRQGVKGTRKAILEYSMRNSYHHQIAYHEDDLITSLCPKVSAVVTENGVYPIVKKYGEFGDGVILNELRYLGTFVKAKRWLEIARSRGRWRITILMNPNDTRKVWYQDVDAGLQCLELATKDPLLGRIATVHDLVGTHIAEIGQRNNTEDEADVAGAKMKLENNAERAEITAAKKRREKNPAKQKQSGRTGAGRRKNQQDEVAATGQAPIPIVVSNIPPTPVTVPTRPHPVLRGGADITPAGGEETSQLIDQWLNEDSL